MKKLFNKTQYGFIIAMAITLAPVSTLLQAADWPTGDEIARHINARDEGFFTCNPRT
jgi:hypothetical protein